MPEGVGHPKVVQSVVSRRGRMHAQRLVRVGH